MTNSIKNWQAEERPREKLLLSGAESLTNVELLAILLREGHKDKTAIDLARELLESANNSLSHLTQFSLDNYQKFRGLGKVKGATLMAAFELGRRVSSELPTAQPQIKTSETVYKIMAPSLKNLLHEECWVLYLNKANKLISKEKVSQGGLSSTVMDIKLIVKKAVDKLASSIILIHNHPSGNPVPGEQDKKQTRALKEAASYFDISLLDHVIIAGNKYFSFSDENC